MTGARFLPLPPRSRPIAAPARHRCNRQGPNPGRPQTSPACRYRWPATGSRPKTRFSPSRAAKSAFPHSGTLDRHQVALWSGHEPSRKSRDCWSATLILRHKGWTCPAPISARARAVSRKPATCALLTSPGRFSITTVRVVNIASMDRHCSITRVLVFIPVAASPLTSDDRREVGIIAEAQELHLAPDDTSSATVSRHWAASGDEALRHPTACMALDRAWRSGLHGLRTPWDVSLIGEYGRK